MSEERFYNGNHTALMDKIYDGLVARYGSLEGLTKACPEWSTFSLYLARSVEVATRPSQKSGEIGDKGLPSRDFIIAALKKNFPKFHLKTNDQSLENIDGVQDWLKEAQQKVEDEYYGQIADAILSELGEDKQLTPQPGTEGR